MTYAPPLPGEEPSSHYKLSKAAVELERKADALPWYRFIEKRRLREEASSLSLASVYAFLGRRNIKC